MGLFDSIKKAFSGFSMAGNARFYHDALGLLPDEDFQTISTGLVCVSPSAVEHVGAAVLSVLAMGSGETVELATSTQAMFGITTRGRLVIGMIPDHDEPFGFASGGGYSLVTLEEQPKETVMSATGSHEPAQFLSLHSSDGAEVLLFIIGISKANEFAGWQ